MSKPSVLSKGHFYGGGPWGPAWGTWGRRLKSHLGEPLLRCAIVWLGCDKARVDCEVLAAKLKEAGHEIVGEQEGEEAIIVSTCAFIREAVEESAGAIERALRQKREGRAKFVVVVGCLPQRFEEGMWQVFPELDAILGVADAYKLPEVLDRIERSREKVQEISDPNLAPAGGGLRVLSTPPWTAFVKIAEGCDKECSFCVIPKIRGKHRSRPIEEVVREARMLADWGVKEVVLVSQDSTQYGLDIYGERKLADLVRALDAVEGIRWVRLLYLFPLPYLLELAKAVAESEKALPYFDVPIQHVSERILSLMKRAGSAEECERIFDSLRETLPGVCLRSSVIVGFPTETEGEFGELLEFVERVQFDRLGAFVYSDEPEAESAKLEPKVSQKEARRRLRVLLERQGQVERQLNFRFVGRNLEVLLERDLGEGWFEGRTYRDAPEIDAVARVFAPGAKVGEFVTARIEDVEGQDLRGRAVAHRAGWL